MTANSLLVPEYTLGTSFNQIYIAGIVKFLESSVCLAIRAVFLPVLKGLLS